MPAQPAHAILPFENQATQANINEINSPILMAGKRADVLLLLGWMMRESPRKADATSLGSPTTNIVGVHPAMVVAGAFHSSARDGSPAVGCASDAVEMNRLSATVSSAVKSDRDRSAMERRFR